MTMQHTQGLWKFDGKAVWAPHGGGENIARDVAKVKREGDGTLIAEAPAMLAALRKISQGADCFTFNSDADAFRFVDMVAEAVAPIIARIDGAAPAPTAQPAGAIGEAGRAAAIEAAQGYASDPEIWNAPSPEQIAGLLQLLGVGLAPVAANDDADLIEAAAGDTCRACGRASLDCSRAPCPTVIAERGEG